MDVVKIRKIDLLRVVTTSLVLFIFTVASILGLMYGMPTGFYLGGFKLISPLELALIILSTKTLLYSWIISGLIIIIIIVLFGRFFCGWICPVGILLEYSHMITEKNRRRVLGGLWTNYEKYLILIAVLAAGLLFNFVAPYLFSPPGVVYRIIKSFIWHGVIVTDLIILSLIFILDLIAIRYGRTWCNTLCPLGITFSSLSFINLIKPKVDQQICSDFEFNCLYCENICPMHIPLTRADEIAMMECNKCLKCWANCPVDAIKIKI